MHARAPQTDCLARCQLEYGQDLEMAGLSVHRAQPELSLRWLCYKPDLSPDLSSMLSVKEPCPLQE